MKILHSSDWHLGKRLDHYSRLEEQHHVLDEICSIADNESVDLILLAGDMFDNFNPSTEAINLYFTSLKRLTNDGQRPVVLIAGNHDSADLIEASDPLARACGIITAGYPHSKPDTFKLDSGVSLMHSDNGFIELQIPNVDYPVRIILTPYANEKRLKRYLGSENEAQEMRNVLAAQWNELSNKYCDDKGVNLLMAHLFFMKRGEKMEVEPDDEKPILHVGGAQAIYTDQIPSSIQYTALGHLHRKQIVDDQFGPVVYCSSPIAYSFGEVNQDKYVVIVHAEPNQKVKLEPIKIENGRRLLRNKFEAIDEAIDWLLENQNALVEVTIVADDYLQAKDRKRLHEVHDGIINIIPEIKNKHQNENSKHSNINLEQNVEELFEQYFLYKHGQAPNEDILDLLKEIIATEAE